MPDSSRAAHQHAVPGPFSCYIIGETTLAIRCADLLVERGHDLVGIVSDNADVIRWTREHSVKRMDPEEDFAAELIATSYDYLFSIVNERVLPPDVTASPRRLAINYHDAPLPRYAGMHATSWALMAGEVTHGITWHVASEKVDAGDAVCQRSVPIDSDETALSLNAKCYDAAVLAFGEMIDGLAAGTVQPVPQDLAERTYFRRYRRPPAAAVLDWRRPVWELSALVRSLDFGPYPNPLGRPKLALGDTFVTCRTAARAIAPSYAAAGTVVAVAADSLTVAASDGDIKLGGFATLGGQAVEIAAVLAKHGLREGMVLPPLAADRAQLLTDLDASATRSERFWQQRLSTLRPVPAPFAAAAPLGPDAEWALAVVPLPPQLSGSGSERPAPSEVEVVTAVAVYLGRINREGEIDLAVRMPSAGVPESERLFATVLPLRLRTDEATSFRAMVDAVGAELESVRRRGTYARDLSDRHPALRSRGGPARFPVQIDVGHVSEHAVVQVEDMPDLRIAVDTPNGGVRLMYRTAAISQRDAIRIGEQLATLFESIAAAPDRPVARLRFVPPRERHMLLVERNDTAREYDRNATLHGLIEAQAVRTPDNVAVVAGDTRLTYRELDDRAAAVARELRALGVGPGTLVGVCTGRSAALVVAVLGVLKAGGAYVPLDSEYPSERLEFMIDDARLGVLVVERGLAGAPAPADAAILLVERSGDIVRGTGANPARHRLETHAASAGPDDAAYVIYTSGSTGRPKGVLIPHRGVVNYLAWAKEAYGGPRGSGSPVHSSPAFDLTVTSMYVPLVTGSAAYLVDERAGLDGLSESLRGEPRYSLVKLTPAHLELLRHQLDPAEAAAATHAFVIGGENLVADALTFWRTNAPDTRLINEYGPTETVVGCCVYEVARGDRFDGSVPIGRPIANTRVYVLDENGELLPAGLPGELCVAGDGVGLGYLHRPRLTAERFVPEPFVDSPGARMYRTGDIVRYRADGNLEFLGRVDGQVKVRGYRIELGEVEAAIASHPAVRDAAAAVHENAGAGRRLVGYYVSESPHSPTDVELGDWLAERLPAYMVPSILLPLSALPLTPNGKLDRRLLPEPRARAAGVGGQASDATETALVAIWERLLEVEGIGVDEDFFELGGQSLTAARLMARVAERFGYAPPLAVFFRNPTIAGMATLVVRGRDADVRERMEPVRAQGSRPPLFYAHGDLAHAGAYLYRLARHLDPEQPLWALHPHDADEAATVAEMADDFVQRILAVQSRGPFRVGGTCNGGIVAFEIARRLRSRGHEVDLLMVAMDSENVRLAPALKVVDRSLRLSERLRGRRDEAAHRARFLDWRERIIRFAGLLPPGDDGSAARLRRAHRLAVEALRVAGRRLRLLPAEAVLEPDAADPMAGDSERMFRDRIYHLVRAMDAYLPERFDGSATMIVAENRVRGDSAGGWRRYCAELDVQVLSGGHDAILESQIERTAARVNAWLDQVREKSGSGANPAGPFRSVMTGTSEGVPSRKGSPQ